MSDFRLDFIGIGAARAGTTWIAQCLSEHPQICLSRQKELNFFCKTHIWPSSPTFYGKGESWLRARFSQWQPGQLRGEFSVSYLIDPESSALIRNDQPDTRIIVSYRNPTDSLYSLYYQGAKQYSVPDTFEGFLAEYPGFVRYGFYYTHIRQYMDYFPSEHIHSIVFDDICSDPEGVLSDLYEFLGVEADYRPPSLHRRINERKAPRSTFVRNLVGNITDFLRTRPGAREPKRVLRLLGAHRVANWIWARNLRSAYFSPMNRDTRSQLVQTYAEENLLLGALLNRDLSHWNNQHQKQAVVQ